jgi:hypothetical protein
MPSRYLQTPTFRSIHTTITHAKQALREADANLDGRLTRAELKDAQARFAALSPRARGNGDLLLARAWGPRAGKVAARLLTVERALDRFEATLRTADVNQNHRIPETELSALKARNTSVHVNDATVLWGSSR